jgi:hypothetical protein
MPHMVAVTRFSMLETGRGWASTAELVHPTLGAVSRISNEAAVANLVLQQRLSHQPLQQRAR